MKKNKLLIIFGVLVLYAATWFSVFSMSVGRSAEFDRLVTEARSNAELGIVIDARRNYEDALAIKDDPEIYIEIADLYPGSREMRIRREIYEDAIRSHPHHHLAYEKLAEEYYHEGSYNETYTVIRQANSRGIETEFLENLYNEIRFHFTIGTNTYQDVKDYTGTIAPAMNNNGMWGFVNERGRYVISAQFDSARPHTSGLASVVLDGDKFFIDTEGNRRLATKEEYDAFGNYVQDRMVAQKDGKYYFLNRRFQQMNGPYENVTSYNQDRAMVRKNGKWAVVDLEGKYLTEYIFTDVVTDTKGIAFRNDRGFVQYEDKFQMINLYGDMIGSRTFEDARVFLFDNLAAVKMSEGWGFVDKEGAVVIDGTFEDARSFNAGKAAVKSGGQWGFINRRGEWIIEPQFMDAMDFNQADSVFIKDEAGWRILRILIP